MICRIYESNLYASVCNIEIVRVALIGDLTTPSHVLLNRTIVLPSYFVRVNIYYKLAFRLNGSISTWDYEF